MITAEQQTYLDSVDRRQALTRERERELAAAAKIGDAQAKADLVDAYMPLVLSVARQYRATPRIERQELIQEGVVGLLEALERFDPDRDVPFWAYARFWVRRSMQRLIAEITRPVVLSDYAMRQLARVRRTQQELQEETRREPTVRELAERTRLTTDQVHHLLAVDRAPRPTQETMQLDDGGTVTFDVVSDPLAEGEYERVLDRVEAEELVGLLSALTERERKILSEHYGLDGEERSYEDVADELGLSVSRVREIERRARHKLEIAARQTLTA